MPEDGHTKGRQLFKQMLRIIYEGISCFQKQKFPAIVEQLNELIKQKITEAYMNR